MRNEIATILGGMTASSGQSLSGAVARQSRRELETIAARAEAAQAMDQARAFLTAAAITNTLTLYGLAEQGLQTAPAAASDVKDILSAYGRGAAFQIATFR
jgi:hypothetical protein